MPISDHAIYYNNYIVFRTEHYNINFGDLNARVFDINDMRVSV